MICHAIKTRHGILLLIMFFAHTIGTDNQLIAQEIKIIESEIPKERISDEESGKYESNNYFSYRDGGDVLSVIDAPGYNPQGLTWDGANLWVSDIGGQTLYQIDTTDGTVLKSLPSPSWSGEGIAWQGEYLFLCDNGGGDQNPDYLYTIDPSDSTILSTLLLPTREWPHGIAWDGQNLWTNNFVSHTITKIDHETGQVLHTIPAPDVLCFGLSWDGEHLWVADRDTDLLYCLDPVDGTVIYTVPSPADNTRDLAYDGECLWVLWAEETKKIYRVDIGNSSGVDDPYHVTLGITGYPNPFSETIAITYRLDQASDVLISITDINGRLIHILEDQHRNPGNYRILWDGHSSLNNEMPGGIYFTSIKTEYATETIKIVKGR